MIIKPANAERFLTSPGAEIWAALVYGPDRGLVRERGAAVIAAWGGRPEDPFAFTVLAEEQLRGEPARLEDEMQALAFGGGTRVIRLRVEGDGLGAIAAGMVKRLDAGAFAPAARLVIEAGDLAKRARLRGAFEGAERAAALACYADGPRELARLLDETLAAAGLTITAEARAELLPRLEGDRALARGELEKLVMLVGPRGSQISREHVRASAVGVEQTDLDALVNAVADGELALVDRELQHALASGASAVGLARALARHFGRLESARARIAAGASAASAMASLRPPVFFAHKDAFARQLSRWDSARLATARAEILRCELALKATGSPDEALIGRLALSLAARAQRGAG